jgi:glycosyltransferase involved in cell wall biosynthesis
VQGINFFWEMERLPRKAVGWVATRFYRGIYRAFDGIVAPSEAVKHAICSRPGIPVVAEGVRTIYHGIDLAEIQQAGKQAPQDEVWRPASSSATPWRLVTVANFDRFKGHRVLLEAIHRLLPEMSVQCVLVGDGPDRRALEATTNAMGLAGIVRFLGCRDDVPAILRGADLCVFPSLWEPLGIAVLEAMALEKPVVACAAGGIPEIITNGEQGVLVRPNDPIALAEGIKRLLLQREWAAALGRRAREAIQGRFDVRDMASAHQQWYEELMARKAGVRQGRDT